MAGLIDYAGLFPPAKLSMAASAEAFARSRMGPHEWMLGRFICPASRLREFSQGRGGCSCPAPTRPAGTANTRTSPSPGV